MTGFWSPIVSWLGALFLAWGRLLLAALPDKASRHLKAGHSAVTVPVSNAEDLRGTTVPAQSDVELLIDRSVVLEHHCLLPRTAASDLKRAVELEAERVMPVQLEQLMLAHRAVPSEDPSKVDVTLVAARKSLVDGILQEAQLRGLGVRKVAAGTGIGSIPFALQKVQMASLRRAMAIASAAAVFLAILSYVPSAYIAVLQQGLRETDAQIREAQRTTAGISKLQRQMRSMRGLSDAVADVKLSGQILDLLAVLTSTSPDDVTIERMSLSDRRLILSGRATSPEAWVIKIQDHEAFDNVRLTSVRSVQGDDKRSFDLHLHVKWPHERAQDDR